MDGTTPINESFSREMPTLQIAWDSTSYNNLCACPRLYELRNVRGYGLEVQNDHITFGGVFASATETYDRERAQGKDHDASLCEALRVAIYATWNAERQRPWVSNEPTKTRNTLFRSIVWYLDSHKDDQNITTHILQNGKPAVELSFRFELEGFTSITDEPYQLCGHMDRIIDWNSETWVLDNKTTKYQLDQTYFSQYSPDNQVSLYSIAGYIILHQHVKGIIIDGLQVLVNGTRFRRKEIERTEDQLEEWLRDFKLRIKQNEQYVKDNYWPQNPKSCGWGNNQCMFRPVCSSDPAARQDMLENFYTRKTWDPLIPR